MLRGWQQECAQLVEHKYFSDEAHFFLQATPGSGKTFLAAEVAKRLLQSRQIDLVLCFAPAKEVCNGITATFSKHLGCSFDGGLGSIGKCLTYQAIQFLSDSFWQTLSRYRVFVVFDEIHHCSTGSPQANMWGQMIMRRVQSLASYTLAMSGTPWRSDELPIALAKYTNPEGKLVVDYQYGLTQAVADGVCRIPKIVLVDNQVESRSQNDGVKHFSSLQQMLKETKHSYRSVVEEPTALKHLLKLACRKLSAIRQQSPNAGGLVVASSVAHANEIAQLLKCEFDQSVCIVTYQKERPHQQIESFRHNNLQWIVSVGMISEGTDIPRLQVCCHVSTVRTELYFRQVLGRILRVNQAPNQEAWLFTFAERRLVEYAQRVQDDIPESCSLVTVEPQNKTLPDIALIDCEHQSVQALPPQSLGTGVLSFSELTLPANNLNFDTLSFGHFHHRVIKVFQEHGNLA
ncbi:DEAD/DEAH box helicase family protein [Neiella marina]|uniref:DEAD/DEAH box helicase family protein n=1 Tax=Neiella holothuriorum TaxID=2870530 RepID=A0ABS7EF47_9GAMM|nr:DEAD/DEAH box helicase family protein [Neiella holothuriorum]MBW8190948.1 DEAD/DEAH box helicase family protein [Neiella holothuriorum]